MRRVLCVFLALVPVAPLHAQQKATATAAAAAAAGVIRLPRAEYDRLKDRAESALEAEPRKTAVQKTPSIEAALYELAVAQDRTSLDVTLDVLVGLPGTDARVTWPLAGVGFLDLLSEKGPAPVVVEGGGKAFVFRRPGRYRLTARYLLRNVETAGGERRTYALQAVPAASARLVARTSVAGSELTLGNDALAPGVPRPVPAGAPLRVSVRLPARLPATLEKPVVTAEVLDVARLERERISQRTILKLQVSRAELGELAVTLPEGSEVLETTGPEEPRVESAGGKTTLVFTRPWKGERTFSIRSVRAKTGDAVALVPSSVPSAASMRGSLVVLPTPLHQVVNVSLTGLVRIDLADLPPFARPFGQRGARAYRVSGAAPRYSFDAPRRALVSPPEALLSEASILTVFSDGKSRMDRRRFRVETKRPFFQVPLDPAEEVLSVSVDGVPVTPRSEEGMLVVTFSGAPGRPRVLELHAKRKDAGPPASGDFTVSQPALPASASVASWTVVLPDDRKYQVVSSSGIQRAGWSADAPTVATRSDTKPANWLAAGGKVDNLAVRVKSQQNARLAGSLVQLRDEKTGAVHTGFTDKDGEARFKDLPKGRYVVESNLSGFVKSERRVEVSDSSILDLEMGQADVGVMSSPSTVPEGMPAAAGPAPSTKATHLDVQEASVVGATSVELDAEKRAAKEDVANTAGLRSLAVEITGTGKRLSLSGPLVGATPLSVTLKVRKS